ncbi:MAG: histidine ammonia-lyase [Paracoccus denitrificans]|nr:MAG: histidine ammonia-lyase [Paracoccus denitrificans]PZO85581.1 MAG: histidine ammonia-lyase [Paracoccus denitrificans]
MACKMDVIELGAATTTPAQIVAIAQGSKVTADPQAVAAVAATYSLIETIIDRKHPVYGLTTGVGDLQSELLRPDQVELAQMRLLRSHASGVGQPHDALVVRAIMACQIRSLLIGVSGVSPAVVDTLIRMLNHGVTPWAPSGGSVGYLIATAHIGLVVYGHGRAWYRDELLDGADAMARAGITPPAIGPRGGLALMSGTYEITAIGALALERTKALIDLADIAGLMALEATRGNIRSFDPRVHALRPHPGQTATAARLTALAQNSEIFAAFRDYRLQDALSLRCIPQVHGAVRDTLAHVDRVLTIEINAITDNPALVMEGDELVALPGGNGHGAPVAAVMDYLAIAISTASSMSQARSERLTSAHLSGLPAFLATGTAADTGLMIPPYVAAALAAENRALAMPMSVHSVPTCAGQEDHVSMGTGAAVQARQAADNLTDILAIELYCAVRALSFHAPLFPAVGTGAIFDLITALIPPASPNREVHQDLALIREAIVTGRLKDAVDRVMGGVASA